MRPHALFMLALALPPLVGARTGAQQPARAIPAVQRDTSAAPDSTAADSADNDIPERAITTGVSYGGLRYEGGRSEQATSAVVRWRALSWLSVGVTPTLAHSAEPTPAALRAVTTRNGLTDLPVEISADHAFDAPLSPSLNFGVGLTIPVGDTASGFGSGHAGASFSLGGGVALTDQLGVHASIGRSLTDFSLQSSFNGTSSEFGDAGVSLQASDRVSLSLGVDGDVGTADPTYGRASSLSGGATVSLPFVSSLSVNASRAISGATPTWSFAIGIGTDFASVGTVAMRSAASRLHRAFGGGTHGLAAKGSKKSPTTRKKRP